ncbi:DEAD/DEAH box helicase [Aphelenchoides besseyi]|nr:DEAD/DEAH box helicase [Aphelenchoides besseyi]KAI6193462.1 DEAD/DEAH box helicase [Aphelenchoides besseyi]
MSTGSATTCKEVDEKVPEDAVDKGNVKWINEEEDDLANEMISDSSQAVSDEIKKPKELKAGTEDEKTQEVKPTTIGGGVPNGFARPLIFNTAAPPKRHPAFNPTPLPRAPGDLEDSSASENEDLMEISTNDCRRNNRRSGRFGGSSQRSAAPSRESRRGMTAGSRFTGANRTAFPTQRQPIRPISGMPQFPRPFNSQRFASSPPSFHQQQRPMFGGNFEIPPPPARMATNGPMAPQADAFAMSIQRAPIASRRQTFIQQPIEQVSHIINASTARPPPRRSDFGDLCKLTPVNWSAIQLEPVVKSFYVEAESVKERSESETIKWISENRIMLHGTRVPRPCLHFNEPGFPPRLVEQLERRFDSPTVVQSIAWPVALSGQDLVSIARTGSGKTLAFLLPGLVHTYGQTNRQTREGPVVLVLSPTRELAQQVADVARDFFKFTDLQVACLYGGGDKIRQRSDMRFGVDVCIATPGRFLEFLREGSIQLTRCTYLVLDEADRMLELGYDAQLKSIMSQLRPDRQTLMFSATWPPEVRGFAKQYQQSPVFMNVGPLEIAANANIEQNVEVLASDTEKRRRLRELLTQLATKEGKTIVFFHTRRRVIEAEAELSGQFQTLAIHGDKQQVERDRVMQEFRHGEARVLFGTDVVSRGLDICDVRAVINYDYPSNIEQYVHRIGRSARHNRRGTAYTFLTRTDVRQVEDLIQVLKQAEQKIPAELLALKS